MSEYYNRYKEIDIHKTVEKYSKNWILFLIAFVLFISAAFFYNQHAIPIYNLSSSILINDQPNQGSRNPTDVFGGLDIFSGIANFQNEIQILKSTPLVYKTLKDLHFEVSYYEKTLMGGKDVYKACPFIVIFDTLFPQPVHLKFYVKLLNNNEFELKAEGNDVRIYSFMEDKILFTKENVNIKQSFKIDEQIKSEYYNFMIIINKDFFNQSYFGKTYYFTFNNFKSMARKYRNATKVEPITREVTIASVSIKTDNPRKGIEYVDQLVKNYLQNNLDEKNYLAINTIQYIDDQLEDITDSLTYAESELQDFRSANRVMDIQMQSDRAYETLRELENEKAQLTVQSKYFDYINDYFEKNKDISDLIAPSSMGIDDQLLNSLIHDLTTLNAEKNSLIDNKQSKSPYLKQLNIRIDNLKNTISENIKYIMNTSEIAINDINQRIAKLTREIEKLPKTERELFGIERKFHLNDAIYTYLMEKRAEAQIAKASNLPDNEIIEPADIDGSGPIAPNKKLNYLIAIFFSLLIPIGIINIKDLLYNKIKDIEEVEDLVKRPIIGKIPHNKRSSELVFAKYPNSQISESIRAVRTNIDFLSKGAFNQTILMTSSIAMEGKSFVSLNLASSYALFDKSTVLIGFDLRKPKLFDALGLNNDVGVSSYLINKANIEDIIQKTSINNLDFISAGSVPPNPLELVASEKTAQLFENLKEIYSYIIIDSPPVGIVSDALILMRYANVGIYVVRRNHVPKRFFLKSLKDLDKKNIENICILFNDDKVEKKKYGYGYGYYEEKPKDSKKRNIAVLS